MHTQETSSQTILTNQQDFIDYGKKIITHELTSLNYLTQHINQDFAASCTKILNCQGRVILLGIGKSGHVAKKIAATLASTGTPAFFVHPAEACHGDLGMIHTHDVIIAISYSGQTKEINLLLPAIKQLKSTIIALCGNSQSTLAKQAHYCLKTTIDQEACPLGLAPTTSTTAALLMGDALAMTVLHAKAFNQQDFARKHPGGQLGQRLTLQAQDIMHTTRLPCNFPSDTIKQALCTMSTHQFGVTAVIHPTHKTLIGIFTDGDLRRSLEQNCDLNTTHLKDIMTTPCKTIPPTTLVMDVLHFMEHHKITVILVTDSTQKPIGIIHMHDIIQKGIL
jgi:arabinose-5-phosphate isomerase